MANVLSVVWFVIAYVVMNASMLVWAALMLPGPVGRARRRIEAKPAAHFFLGLLFWGLTLLVSLGLISAGKHGLLQLLGWILAAPMLGGSIVGGAALAGMLGDRIAPKMRTESPMLALVGGALCNSLAMLLPVIGWFVFLPLAGMVSIGAGMLGIFSRREVGAPAPAPHAAPEPQFVLPAAAPAPGETL